MWNDNLSPQWRRELLAIRREIATDKQYQCWLEQIEREQMLQVVSSDNYDRLTFDHGWGHLQRVAQTVINLQLALGEPLSQLRLGWIAAWLHDIGVCGGKDCHAVRGADMADDFLHRQWLLDSDEEIDQVTQAIRYHGDGGQVPHRLTLLLTLADKVDLCRARAYGLDSPLTEIDDYRVELVGDILRLYYRLRSPRGRETFYFIPKSLTIPAKVTSQLGWCLEYYLDGVREEFADRQEYHGWVYCRQDSVCAPELIRV